MNLDSYIEIKNNADFTIFSFISEGRYGKLIKIVRFDRLEKRNNTFNLALGTVSDYGTVDFDSVTNNGDRNKVLATVAKIVYTVTERYPGMNIYITGSDYRRTLLYQRAITYAYEELSGVFNIYGLVDDGENDRRRAF